MYKVLLIEDDKFLQKAILDKFEKEGYKVVVAGDGKEGVSLALKEQPDFILLDIIMPLMDGEDTLRDLKLIPETKEIPVAILTAVSPDNSLFFKDNELLTEVVGYWQKDQTGIDEIVDKVRNYLAEKSPIKT